MPAFYRLLASNDAHWRPSKQMGVLNTGLARQLEVPTLAARLWRLRPGEASKRHRHRGQVELYLLLEGLGRVRVEDDLVSLAPSDALAVEPRSVRQLFNDTAEEQLWLVVGAPSSRPTRWRCPRKSSAGCIPTAPAPFRPNSNPERRPAPPR
jgi:uncharacterized cupin superfamily protein